MLAKLKKLFCYIVGHGSTHSSERWYDTKRACRGHDVECLRCGAQWENIIEVSK